MSAIHSGPNVLAASDDPDRYVSRLPLPLVCAFCAAGALFAGSAIAGVAYWLIGMIRAGRLCILLAALALVACGPEPVEIARGPVRVVAGSTSCQHFGYCYTCAPGMNMKFECKFKLSQFCPGRQDATLRVQDVTYRRAEETYTRTSELGVVSVTGHCR